MKIKLLFAAAVAVTLMFTSCSKDDGQGIDGYGEIKASFTADYGVKPSRSESRANKVDVITPDIANFYVHLKKDDGSYEKTWSSVGEFPTTQKFLVGNYTMEAYYGALDDEGFNKPYFYGSTKFAVNDDETAEPSITATLANTMVTLEYTDAFKNYFPDYKTTIHSAGGTYIDFVKGETRAAYVKPGTISMEMQLTKTNGQTVKFEPAEITDAAPRTHYNITFDVNGGEVGDATLKITFDTTTEVKPITITLSDELFNAPAPTVTPVGYTSGTTMKVVEGETPSSPVDAHIIARAGFQSVTLTTISPYLINRGWPSEIDLMKATADQKTLLTSMGLKVAGLWGSNVPAKDNMAVIDFTNLISKLRPLNGTSTHSFTIVVKDKFTKVSDAVTLTVDAPAVILQMSDPSTVFTNGTAVKVNVTYDGNDIANNVKFKATNSSGVWTDCAVTSVTKLADNSYRVALTIPATASSQSLKAYYKNDVCESEALTIEKKTFTIAASENNVWARKATIVLSSSAVDASALVTGGTLYIAKSGGEYAAASEVTKSTTGGTMLVSGLTPGTTYKAKVVLSGDYSGESNEISFTTEAATQVPNAGMESWTSDKVGTDGSTHSSANWTNYYPWSSDASTKGWNTINFTTLQACSGVGGNYAYVASPGTISTTDVHGGSAAALVRTVAWGTGNTAGGSLSIVKNVTAGELYLGTYSTSTLSPTYGYSFTSRPSNLSFYYKYTPKNSADYGLAEIDVLDASGNVIATKSTNISGSVTSYTLLELSLSYTSTAKAASIRIIFRSSNNSSCLNRSNVSLPGFGFGYESYTTTGSQLYIDDIVLGY